MTKFFIAVVTAIAAVWTSAAVAENAPPRSALDRMDIKEVTVFKDGHSFVLHEGRLPVNESGEVILDYLPTPVLGTFWPYANQAEAKLTSVVASRQPVSIRRTALDLKELLKANIGAEAVIRESGRTYLATIVDVPTRSASELASTSPPNADPQLPQEGQVILLKTTEGVKAVLLDRITDVTFTSDYTTERTGQEFRNFLTLKLEWEDKTPKQAADVGMVYLQKGLRWIPNYKVTLDGNGKAVVKLQATLVNDLADLTDATAHLVIGVPTFAFADIPDPIALQKMVAELSRRMG